MAVPTPHWTFLVFGNLLTLGGGAAAATLRYYISQPGQWPWSYASFYLFDEN